jgi:ATP-binding cassette subfamily C protein CydC
LTWSPERGHVGPTQHLDVTDADPLLRRLLDPAGGLIAAERTVVVATHHLPAEIGVPRLVIKCDYCGCRLSIPA